MTPPARDERRWTLIDHSEDYTPRWKVANERGPVAGEYAESVEVMAVSEHEAALAAVRQVDEAMVERALNAEYGSTSLHDLGDPYFKSIHKDIVRAALLAALTEQTSETKLGRFDPSRIERTIERVRSAARKHGWAVAVHGSLGRDIDLIAVPWTDEAHPMFMVIAALEADNFICERPTRKPHQRVAYVLHGGNGGDYIDLSLMETCSVSQGTDPVRARLEADLAALREAVQAVVSEGCREELGEPTFDKCWKPAEFVLWGKLIAPEGLGPRCYEHAAKHVGDRALGDPSWAIIDLRPLRAVLASADSERITHGRHCTCSACAQEDWTNADLAPCGMHGLFCPALYQP